MAGLIFGFVGSALAIIFGVLGLAPEGWPKMPPWAVYSGCGLGILLLGVALGLWWATKSGAGKLELRSLLDALERLAAEEAIIATMLYVDIKLPADLSFARRVHDRVELTDDERNKWRGCLRTLDVECGRLALPATRDAIRNAVDRLEGPLNRVTAYMEYHAVSRALKDEVGRVGRFTRAAA